MMNLEDVELLQREFLGNSLWQWIVAAATLLGTLAAFWIARRILLGKARKASEKAEGLLSTLVWSVLGRTRYFPFVFLGLFLACIPLDVPDRVRGYLSIALRVGLIVQAGLWGSGLVNLWLARYVARLRQSDPGSVAAVSSLGYLGRLFLWTLVLLLALHNCGVQITSLIAGLGIGGIAIALAVQNVLGDMFASLAILFDKPFEIGDFIVVADMAGTVEHIGLKTTRVRSLSGEQLVFANTDLLGSRVRNFKRLRERRIVFSFGVVYQTTADQLAAIPAIVREIVEAVEETRFDRAHFKSYGASSLDFEVVYFVLVPEYATYMDIQQEINLALFRRFESEGIEFAYPTQTIYVRAEPEAETPAGVRE